MAPPEQVKGILFDQLPAPWSLIEQHDLASAEQRPHGMVVGETCCHRPIHAHNLRDGNADFTTTLASGPGMSGSNAAREKGNLTARRRIASAGAQVLQQLIRSDQVKYIQPQAPENLISDFP